MVLRLVCEVTLRQVQDLQGGPVWELGTGSMKQVQSGKSPPLYSTQDAHVAGQQGKGGTAELKGSLWLNPDSLGEFLLRATRGH